MYDISLNEKVENLVKSNKQASLRYRKKIRKVLKRNTQEPKIG